MFDPVTEPFFRLDVAGLSHSLIVTSFSGREAIDELFSFELQVQDEEGELDLAGLMYRPCYLTLGASGAGIHGQIQGVNLTCSRLEAGYCRLQLGPRVGCLALRFQRRIFQQRSVPGLVAQVLGEHGLGADDFRLDLKGQYLLRAYCVQFDESDWQFIRRLCAEEGIHFHFQHGSDGHRLVFADRQGAFRRAREVSLCSAESAGVRDFYVSLSGYARRRGGRVQASARGESDLPGLRCGTLMPLSGHPCAAWNRLWLITGLEHHGQSGDTDPQAPSAALVYRNAFQATSWEVAWRQAPRARPPVLSGLFRAWVAEAGEQGACLDAQGRIAVYLAAFYQGEGSIRGACWLPCAASMNHEMPAFIAGLRVGTAVWVRFLHGHPDRPQVVGRCDVELSRSPPRRAPVPPTEALLELLRAGHPLVLLPGPAPGASRPWASDCRGAAAGGQGGAS